MYINDVRSFSEMTPDQVGWFIEDVMKEQQDEFVRRLAQADSDDPVEDARGVSASVLEKYLTVLVDVYNLGSEFIDFPELVMVAHPLRGVSSYEVATEFGIVTSGWIPPVPDQVLHPLLEAAHRWVDTYSVDVLFAQDAYLAAFDGLGKTMPKNMPRSIQAALKAVKFDARGDLPEIWRQPLGGATARDGSTKRRGITVELRDLHYDLRNAATVVLQAETGIRVAVGCDGCRGSELRAGQIVAMIQPPRIEDPRLGEKGHQPAHTEVSSLSSPVEHLSIRLRDTESIEKSLLTSEWPPMSITTSLMTPQWTFWRFVCKD